MFYRSLTVSIIFNSIWLGSCLRQALQTVMEVPVTHAAVVCPQPVVAEAAAEILAAGGNAVDAAVAGMALQAVVDPLMCGPGGYGVMTVHDAASGRDVVLDFFARAPLAVKEGAVQGELIREFAYDYGYIVEGGHNEIGPRSIATPGTVAGMATALRQFGSMPWHAVLEPAAVVAEDGFPLTPAQSASWYADDGPDKPGGLERMAYSDSGRALYTDDGAPLAIGTRVRNRDLAATLRQLMRRGPDDFYLGELAQTMVAHLGQNESLLGAADFKSFEVAQKAPLTSRYRGATLAFPGYPGGGLSILAALNLLELNPGQKDWPTADSVTAVAEALQAALQDKATYLAGDRTIPIPVEMLISKEYARQRMHLSVQALDPGSELSIGAEPPSTTHIAVVDRHGNAVAATHTLASGSGVISPGLGFMYNNFMHGYDPRPGRWNSLRPGATRPASMAPGLVFDSAGELIGVLGASGSTRIVSALVQVITHLLDRNWDPCRAVMAPRVNVQLDGTVQCEGRIPSRLERSLEQSGRSVRRHLANYDPYFGKAHVLWRSNLSRAWSGAADPRGDGGTAIVTT
ncbi:gamma-glutamyltransferase [soil metagenome]